MGRMRNLWALLALVLLSVSIHDIHVSADVIPSENECRPYIEKAIHELKNVEVTGTEDDKESIESTLEDTDSIENEAAPEAGTEEDGNESVEENDEKSLEEEAADENKSDDAGTPSQENQTEETASVEDAAPEATENSSQESESKEQNDSADEAAATEGEEKSAEQTDDSANESAEANTNEETESKENDADSKEANTDSVEGDSKEGDADSKEANADSVEGDSKEQVEGGDSDSKENEPEAGTDSKENDSKENESAQTEEKEDQDSTEPAEENESEQANEGSNEESTEGEKTDAESVEEGENQTAENEAESKEEQAAEGDSKESSENDSDNKESEQANDDESVEEKVRAKRSLPDEAGAPESDESTQTNDNESQEAANESLEAADESPETTNESLEAANESPEATNESLEAGNESQEANSESQEAAAVPQEEANTSDGSESQETAEESVEDGEKSEEEQVEATAEDLTIEFEIPKNLRPRTHVAGLLGLDAESSVKENALRKTGDVVLKELKRVFDNAIHPLESMYKYRDLSNRHFGDPEIFSKPLVLFMGPWSGGKSTILNYLTDNEYTANSIRSGAEPSPAYFNIMMHGDEPEVLDGTQLAADWTFSGLQKFGQGLMDRLRGQKLPNKLLERVNIVEIPGILEVRKQVSKYFPFNDACQWFIDRADIIFLVYDPSKLDVGPETEAILDQLKGREYQTRILLNKADQVKPEELLRVQGALIWNISPLMSSAQPPVMYTVSLWSHPFEHGAPVRLLQAQERAFLTDLREAIDKRIENKIASARRFAVRIRNHAKMVDCYLTTYYNQKGLFSNKKQTADKIIEHPQNYNIYEGLSTLTNISRYDLPDPEVYMDFFRLNPLYEFKKLAETCTYFKGCPINKLDIAIAYDLPELVGKYKKLQEQNLIQLRKEYDDNCNQTEAELPVKIINSR